MQYDHGKVFSIVGERNIKLEPHRKFKRPHHHLAIPLNARHCAQADLSVLSAAFPIRLSISIANSSAAPCSSRSPSMYHHSRSKRRFLSTCSDSSQKR